MNYCLKKFGGIVSQNNLFKNNNYILTHKTKLLNTF